MLRNGFLCVVLIALVPAAALAEKPAAKAKGKGKMKGNEPALIIEGAKVPAATVFLEANDIENNEWMLSFHKEAVTCEEFGGDKYRQSKVAHVQYLPWTKGTKKTFGPEGDLAIMMFTPEGRSAELLEEKGTLQIIEAPKKGNGKIKVDYKTAGDEAASAIQGTFSVVVCPME